MRLAIIVLLLSSASITRSASPASWWQYLTNWAADAATEEIGEDPKSNASVIIDPLG